MTKPLANAELDAGKHASLSQKAEAIAAAWLEAREVYPLYSYLATKFHLSVPPVRDSSLSAACPASDVFEKVVLWLGEMDSQIRTNQLRQLLHSIKDVRPESLRALILRLLRRSEKSATDRDNVDLLLATYFALCAPEDLYSCEITLADVAQVLHSVLPDADPTELEWCEPLNQILGAMKKCEGLKPVFAAKLLEKGRKLKDAAGFMFYDPAALVAFTRFNFLARRSFFRLLHSDLRAIREGLTALERQDIFAVDCRSAGMGERENTRHLREITLAWRQPISADYVEDSANRTFEQLLAIRAAVESSLGVAQQVQPAQARPIANDSQDASAKSRKIIPTGSEKAFTASSERDVLQKACHEITETATHPAAQKSAGLQKSTIAHDESTSPSDLQRKSSASSESKVARSDGGRIENKPVTAANVKDREEIHQRPDGTDALSPVLESCLERIWQQLIEAPPAKGRSMSTVVLGDARILLSAWEVNAFLSEGGQLSEDLRRGVAARALLALARSEKGGSSSAKLSDLIALGREVMKYLQQRVDQAQQVKNTEAAVNLGITARRLLSAIEEAQS